MIYNYFNQFIGGAIWLPHPVHPTRSRMSFTSFRHCSYFFINATGYIVDAINGDDTNTGQNVDDAFKTINRCVQELKNAGDECQIR